MNPIDASPTSRALLALEMIQAAPGITAERLAAHLGVSDRAARRYVGILREAGIPIDAVRGPYGGYRVGRGVRLPPLMFSADEALGLVMAVLDGHHDAGDAASPVGSALGKIVRVLPAPVAAQAEAVRRATAAAPDRAAARPDPSITAALVQASSDQRRVRISYRSEAGSEWESDVDPWGVVVRHGRWYLLCRVGEGDTRRAYRIDRIGTAEALDDGFDPPGDLDPVGMLEEHLAVGWEYDVEVVIEAPADTVAAWIPPTIGRLEPLDAGTSLLVGSTSNPVWYAERLAAIPVPYRIVQGEAIRRAARALAERMLAASDTSAAPRESVSQERGGT